MTPWVHRTLIPLGLIVSIAVGWTAARWYPFLDDVMCGLEPCTAAEVAAGRSAAWSAMIPGAAVFGLGLLLQFFAARPARRPALGVALGAGLAVVGPLALAVAAFGGAHLFAAIAVAFLIGVAASVSRVTGRVHGPRADLIVAYLCAVMPVALLAGILFTRPDALDRALNSAWLFAPLLIVAGAWGLAWVYRRQGLASRVAAA